MKTPITNNAYRQIDGEGPLAHSIRKEDTMIRLELDRAALMEALILVRDYVVTMKGRGHDYQVCIDSALSAARANFPEP